MRYDETAYGDHSAPREGANFIAVKPPAGVGVRIYNDDTSDASFERLTVGKTGTTFEIKSEASSDKTVRDIVISAGGVTALTASSSGAVLSGAATALKSATTSVVVSAATAPAAGQVLVASSSTEAAWVDVVGVAAPGANTQLTYNDGGNPGAALAWTYAKASGALSGAGPLTVTPATDITPATFRASAGPGTAAIVQWQTSANGALGNIGHDGTVTAPQYRLSGLNTAPASAAATGTKGEIRITADALYACIATDTWVKADLAPWA